MDNNQTTEKQNEDEVEYVKKYVPVYGIGSYICSHCIIDSAKDFVLDEFPEVAYYETHLDEKEYEDPDSMTDIAIKCLILLGKKFLPPNTPIFFLDAENLVNNSVPGSIFIGCNYEFMNPQETKEIFINRVMETLLSLNIFNKKEENKDNLNSVIKDNEDDEHEMEEFELQILSDVYVSFIEKANEDDKDDLDIGYETGKSDGIDLNYELVKVALYKMYKKKKIKNLDFIMEELHDTIAGMDSEDFQIWKKKFVNYMEKKKERDSRIEMGDE